MYQPRCDLSQMHATNFMPFIRKKAAYCKKNSEPIGNGGGFTASLWIRHCGLEFGNGENTAVRCPVVTWPDTPTLRWLHAVASVRLSLLRHRSVSAQFTARPRRGATASFLLNLADHFSQPRRAFSSFCHCWAKFLCRRLITRQAGLYTWVNVIHSFIHLFCKNSWQTATADNKNNKKWD